MQSLASLLQVQDILLGVETTDKRALFEQISLLFARNYQLDPTLIGKSLIAREQLGSTGLGQGVAIPHGRIRNLKQVYAAFLQMKEPVPFEAPDGKPVDQIFVLLVPEQATTEHLELLSKLAQIFCEKDFRESLRKAVDPAIVHASLVHLLR